MHRQVIGHVVVLGLGLSTTLWVAGCGDATVAATKNAEGQVYTIEPGDKARERAQEALIAAKPGDVIHFAKGSFEFDMQLSCTSNGITLRGDGPNETILSFKGQLKGGSGGEGLLLTGNNLTVENLAVEDTKGDAIKANGSDGITFRNVRVEWTGEAKETNGAYGLYPVLCNNVLIEDCVAIGASDAGIYVGQSKNIIVRRSRAERNVAGIEIENSIGADVYDCVATNNAGGILIFNLPGLQLKNGKNVRVFNNKSHDNNHRNFAPPGNIVANVPPGTGMMIMAIDNVEVFDNTLANNQTCNLSVVSFLITQKPFDDPEFDPYAEGIYIHDNTFEGGGDKPAGAMGLALRPLLGVPAPSILYDARKDPKKLVDGQLPPEMRLYLGNNSGATFAAVELDIKKLMEGKPVISRDPAEYSGELPRLPEVTIAGGQC